MLGSVLKLTSKIKTNRWVPTTAIRSFEEKKILRNRRPTSPKNAGYLALFAEVTAS